MKNIAEVKKDFLEHIPEQNEWIASTVFDLMAILLSSADLDFDKMLKAVPQDIWELAPFGTISYDENGHEIIVRG